MTEEKTTKSRLASEAPESGTRASGALVRRLVELCRREWRQLTTISASDRPWQMPVAAALSVGLPLLVGAYFGHMDYGLISSLGGLVFLYTPETPLHHRMICLIACAFAMSACYALGLISHFLPVTVILSLTFIAIVVTMLCRFYQVGSPGSVFFIMAAAIGAYSPSTIPEIPLKVGLITLGCLLACMIAFAYSLLMLRRRPASPIAPLPAPSFDFVVFDSCVIGCCVGIALSVAYLFQLEKAYWAPVSCLVIIQGMSLRAMWTKQFHRLLGTGIGLLVAWGLLSLPLDDWSIPIVMMLLSLVVETTVVRHYGFAVIFVTPMTILLADAATLDPNAVGPLVEARFLDTVAGSLTGFAGGACLHNSRFRATVGGWMRRIPVRIRDL
ncbi:MAG: FUSC family protein [Zoogloeaceae bacterium]|jgi:uncharacterized membrane protein YccC|nr:FUSC family protein [Zoogloeaceae bacterium]